MSRRPAGAPAAGGGYEEGGKDARERGLRHPFRSAPLSEERLAEWGTAIGAEWGRGKDERPLVLFLSGDLGAGKSVLARAIGRGAGVLGAIPSPTYNLLLRYPLADDRSFIHLDLYRLEDPEELIEIGWEELGRAGELVVVEWPERAEGASFTEERWDLRLRPAEGNEELLRVVEGIPAGSPGLLPRLPLMEPGG